jgi:nitrate reductase NapAB chaperone NapD
LLFRSAMPISALVLTVDPEAPGDLLAALAADPRLTVGEAVGVRIPVVAETATARGGAELVEELLRTDGVLHVVVVCVELTEEGDEEWTGERS